MRILPILLLLCLFHTQTCKADENPENSELAYMREGFRGPAQRPVEEERYGYETEPQGVEQSQRPQMPEQQAFEQERQQELLRQQELEEQRRIEAERAYRYDYPYGEPVEVETVPSQPYPPPPSQGSQQGSYQPGSSQSSSSQSGLSRQ